MPGLRRAENREWDAGCSGDPAVGVHSGLVSTSSSLPHADRRSCGWRGGDRCCRRRINAVRRRLHLFRWESLSLKGEGSSLLGLVRLRRQCGPPRRRSLHAPRQGGDLFRYRQRANRGEIQGGASLLSARNRHLGLCAASNSAETAAPFPAAATSGVFRTSIRGLPIHVMRGPAPAD
jgi:hypothetical protein